MNIFSPFYILSVLLLMSVTAGLWLCLRKMGTSVQKAVLLILMLVNTFQHLLKFLIYPQYWGMGFTSLSTAYNMCAVLILLSPLSFVLSSRFLKNFVLIVGTVAGIGAIVYPVWYLGIPVQDLGWDYARFYICHGLLFVTSVLPLPLHLHKPSYKEFWQLGIGFLLALCLILVNDVIFIALGLFPGADPDNLYQSLINANPCMMMGPQKGFEWVENVVKYFSLPYFMGENSSGNYAPILWYAGAVYLGITVISFGLFAVMDRKNLLQDIKNPKKSHFSKK